MFAKVAQLVEHAFRKGGVAGSIPAFGSVFPKNSNQWLFLVYDLSMRFGFSKLLVFALVSPVLFFCLMHFYGFEREEAHPLTDQNEFSQKMHLPALPFVQNVGQLGGDEGIKFYADTPHASVRVTSQAIIYSLQENKKKDRRSTSFSEYFLKTDGEALDLKPAGRDKSITKVSVFKGNDKQAWRPDIPNFNTLALGEVWENIEVDLVMNGDSVEKLFNVRAGGDSSLITMRIHGGNGMYISGDGKLVIRTPLGEAYLSKPVAYQFGDDGRKEYVEVSYRMVQDDIYGFDVGDYDPAKILVIDPLLASTFLEGSLNYIDYPTMAVASDGSVYVAGETEDNGFPIDGAYGPAGDYDMVIAKFSSDLTQLLALTYLGGSGEEESWNSTIDFDELGNIFVSVVTSSTDYPTTEGAFDTSQNENSDDYAISKFNGDLTQLLASTYIGTAANERGGGLAVDNLGNIYGVTYVTALPACNTFPTTTDAAFGGCNLNTLNSAIVKLDSNLTTLLASTMVPGMEATAIKLDSANNVFIAGIAWDENLATTTSSYDPTYSGVGLDAAIMKFNSDLTEFLNSTYVGGNLWDNPAKWSQHALAIDSNDNVFLGMETQSTDMPTTEESYDRAYADHKDSYIAKFDNDLSNLLAGTYLGGDNTEEGMAIALDSHDNVYVNAYTDSSNFFGDNGDVFPTTPGAYQEDEPSGAYWGVPFITKFNNNLTDILASTFIGGADSGAEYFSVIAIDANDNVYVSGPTEDSSFPVTGGAYDTTLDSGNGFFISKLDSNLSDYAVDHLKIEGADSFFEDDFENGFSGSAWSDSYSNSPYGASDSVYASEVLSDGKILIVGTFDQYNKVARSKIARINADGSLDTSFIPPAIINNGIYDVSVQSDGKIIIVGAFTDIDGNSVVRVA